MTTKIRIKIGAVEVECEATEDFLKDELPTLLKTVKALYEQSGKPAETNILPEPNDPANKSGFEGAVTTFAQKLGVKTGSDLAFATCARLVLVGNKASVTRDEIREEMKQAAGYYKASYGTNLPRSLVNLVKSGDLIQPTNTSYGLSADKLSEVRQRLA